MRLRNELDVIVASLAAVQVLTSFAAIALLARTGPVLERVLSENVESVAAVEEMLGALAIADDEPRAAHDRFGRGLARARAVITEEAERPLLDRVQEVRQGALAGQPEDVRAAVTALRELSAVNRRSMEETDAQAQRYAYAGAWTMAVLGVASFGIAVVISRRLVRRVDEPLAEIDAALAAVRRGDVHRRADVGSASDEVQRIALEVNELLDARRPRAPSPLAPGQELDRAALLRLLADRAEPTVLLDARGCLRAANDAARDRLAAPDGAALRGALAQLGAAPGETTPGVARATPLGDAGWLVVLGTDVLGVGDAPRAAEG